ncbi:MAG TPA: glycine zipper domain-containing protein [Flavobacteriales bacterium]|nr:glycine zipper domain-containing protein [Flavobacteriales bacterium]HRA18351.1 glycine zipper domain-containing protein [Flavobacteriales bacterium]
MDEVGGGIASGAASGAVLGTTILPGWGTAIGAVAGGIVGGIKGGQEKKKREEYEAKEKSIPLQDPNQVAYLDKIRRNQKALAAGTDPMTSYRMQEARNRGQQTALNLMRSSGGSTQALTSNILRANEGTNRAIAGAGAMAEQRSDAWLAAEGTLVGSMADRAYRRQLSQARMLFAQQQQMKQARVDQGNAALGNMGTVAGGFSKTGGSGKSFGGAPKGAQMGSLTANSSYVEPTLGQQVSNPWRNGGGDLGNNGQSMQWNNYGSGNSAWYNHPG